ncbi:hypothetical protein [Marinococcus luteus]|uniref:hypothetical protein n=1 Tax=Marinococcus luteus TaxID=1122204 RepID=UPI002ACC4990|nr:hypothetical protein [Marinococcus luteus]MDZ5782113.1 hypothetical protein [Marinococcus luteus]
MANTPYNRVRSQNILAAHISGLGESAKKLESALNMQIDEETEYTLNDVSDQEDANYRYRIYEGDIRNWLDDPGPVIYRNGSEVDSSEYTVHPAYGAVIFNDQQNSDDEIAADFTYITDESGRLESLERDVSHLKDTRFGLRVAGEYQNSAISGVGAVSNGTDGDGIDLEADTIYAFPLFVRERTTFDDLAVNIESGSTGSLSFGLYEDDGAGYPSESVEIVNDDSDSAGTLRLDDVFTIDAGYYWLALLSDATPSVTGAESRSLPVIATDFSDAYCGWEVGHDFADDDGLPGTFPSSADLLPIQDVDADDNPHAYPQVFVRKEE